ncbi:hypothetical protein ROTAS13_03862 [Roseomonas sp. TAS13]|uniref:hypothetical protein n=1 Tax=Roseomonas sp. TAS13 TaxID=1926319 RepID=UPI00095ED6A3|nr:hypothetical protein [Roseomonas sp. TAS13]USQ73893.1 hypothetical protein NF552_21610 [Roseomonas mucosa]GAV36175.1 hypothetical protein ROTAS13_03862 [Roseomonas sp. TAS13]
MTNRKDPIEQGGWSAYVVLNTGADLGSPAVHPNLRGDGRSGLYGWCESPALEALRTEWLATSDPASQLALAKRMQGQAFQDLPYLPLGQVAQLTVYRAGLSGVLKGVPVFWNLRRG